MEFEIEHYAVTTERIKQQLEYFAQGSRQSSFIDHEFPANLQSLVSGMETYAQQWDQVVWQNPWKKLSVFSKGIDLDRVSFKYECPRCLINVLSLLQGSGFSSENLFLKQSGNCHAVWLFSQGEWNLVVLDQSFPFVKGLQTLFLFSYQKEEKGFDASINVLEKALAKLLGSYFRLLYWQPVLLIQNLTGAVAKKIELFDRKTLLQEIKSSLSKQEFLLVQQTTQETTNIFAVKSLLQQNSSIFLLLQKPALFLPRESSFLPAELRAKTPEDFDCFWVDFEEFQKKANKLHRLVLHQNYYFNSLRVSKDSWQILSLNLTQQTHLYI